jgi:hypothetical protein
MDRKFQLSVIVSLTVLSMTTLKIAREVKPSVAQTEVPLTIRAGGTEGTDGFALLSLSVPNRDTTKSAYGGQLRFYDVHIAKMFEVTDFLCKRFGSNQTLSGYEWFYSAANGQTSMGRFRISCSLARDIAIAYGSRRTERTAIGLDTEGGPPESEMYSIPILNISGSKVQKWMDFVQRFRPISSSSSSNTPVVFADTPFPVSKILPQIKRKTQMPIVLPSRLPFPSQVFYNVEADSDRYSVDISHTPDCQGTPCYIGAIRAERGGKFSQPSRIRGETFRNLQLAGGIRGIFANACGAYCTALVEWQYEGVLYQVTIKNGREKDLIQIANSAIAAGPR